MPQEAVEPAYVLEPELECVLELAMETLVLLRRESELVALMGLPSTAHERRDAQ